MAGRPTKAGLDYFELDCHMDEKVKLIQAEFGLKGFAVVVKLYQQIYGQNGYYCEWNDDMLLLFMSENGVPCDSKNLIKEIVSACIRRNIFSEELFKKYGILTSPGVQKRYLNAVSRRESVELKKEYLLVSVGKNMKNVVINSISVDRNSINVSKNPQSKGKESRVKERKDREDARAERIEEFLSVYPKYCNRYLAEHEYASLLLAGKITEDELVQCALNYADSCRILETPERYIKNAENFLKEFVFEKYLPGKYKKPAAQKQKNGFNDFEQNDYDFETLEKELTEN